jgi:nitrogen regulatory protein PII-like uncharacterized protein
MDITITLTNTEYKGLEYAAVSPQDWADNAIKNRARKAIDEIVDITVKYCLDNNISIPSTRDEIVSYAFENELVKTLSEVQEEQALEE